MFKIFGVDFLKTRNFGMARLNLKATNYEYTFYTHKALSKDNSLPNHRNDNSVLLSRKLPKNSFELGCVEMTPESLVCT